MPLSSQSMRSSLLWAAAPSRSRVDGPVLQQVQRARLRNDPPLFAYPEPEGQPGRR